MSIVRLSAECIPCLTNKFLKHFPYEADEQTKLRYAQDVLSVIADAPETTSAPELVEQITALQEARFGIHDNFADVKRHFNALMLSFVPRLQDELDRSEDPLRLAVQYALIGNYIDFGAMDNVDESKLETWLDNAKSLPLDETEFDRFRDETARAARLVYLTDNCGEIVLDKLLIGVLKRHNPSLHIDVIVRGAPVLNDATLEDAAQIGLHTVAPVMDNGTAIAGTCLEKISAAARECIETADVILSKGQGNFETLRCSGKNIYYLFMCKCAMFANRFGVPLYSGMLVNDLRMDQRHN